MCSPMSGAPRRITSGSSSNWHGADARRARVVVGVRREVAVRDHLRILDHLGRRGHHREDRVLGRERGAQVGVGARRRSSPRTRRAARRGARRGPRCRRSAGRRAGASSPSARHVGSQWRTSSIMLSSSQRPSPVRYGPISGLDSTMPPPSGSGSVRRIVVATRSGASVHTAVPSSATSTTDPVPGLLPLVQRGRHAAGEERAARTVAHRGALHHERTVGRGEHVTEPAACPVGDGVEAALVGVGPALALPVALGVDRGAGSPPTRRRGRAAATSRADGRKFVITTSACVEQPVERGATVGRTAGRARCRACCGSSAPRGS